MEKVVGEIFSEFGRIDILVYASGIFTYSLVKNKLFEDWHKMIATNCQVIGNFLLFTFIVLSGAQ